MRIRNAATAGTTMLIAVAGLHGCTHAPAAAPSQVPQRAQEAPPPPPSDPQAVWTAAPEVAVRHNGSATAIARPLMRLDVDGRGEDGTLHVVCAYCEGEVRGSVSPEEVLWEPAAPVQAADGTISDFALAVREAAAWRRVEELLPVMAADFTFGFAAQRDRALAPRAWEWEEYRGLDQVPRLIDEGLVSIGRDFWVAPAAYAEAPGYDGLRVGFRRNPETDRWEWLFLVKGEQ